jgi:hypothetical protein
MSKKNHEDELVQFAFGEMDSKEAQIFEADALRDSGKQQEIDLLKFMREDLRSMREVPEMQYSKDRLREAILGQGLRPEKVAFNWNKFILAPLALASVIAVGYFGINGTKEKDLVVATELPIAKPSNSLERIRKEIEKPSPVADISAPVSPQKVKPSSPVVAKTRPRVLLPQATEVKVAMKVARRAPKTTNTRVAALTALKPAISSSETVAFGSASLAGPAEPTTIVVIDPTQETGSGASTATEVTSPSNVVIGG